MFARRCLCVRNCWQHGRVGTLLGTLGPCLWGVLQSGHFWRFHTSCNVVSCGRRGASEDTPTCFIICRKSFCVTGAILLRGNRITLEHSQQHHFGTQPFWHHFGTQNATYHQTTANKTDIRFTDRRSTLEASRVPKRCLYQKKAPMRNVVFRSMSPSATPATQNEIPFRLLVG